MQMYALATPDPCCNPWHVLELKVLKSKEGEEWACKEVKGQEDYGMMWSIGQNQVSKKNTEIISGTFFAYEVKGGEQPCLHPSIFGSWKKADS